MPKYPRKGAGGRRQLAADARPCSATHGQGAESYLQKENATTLPRAPLGADCDPLAFCARGSIKVAPKATPPESRDTVSKLMATLVQVAAKLRDDPHWLARAAKGCRRAPERLRWAIKRKGAQIVGKAWESVTPLA